MQTRSTLEAITEDEVYGVELKSTCNTVEKLDRQQMALDGRRPQFLGSKGVRCVLKQIPHVGHSIAATLREHGQATTSPEVYP